MLRPTAFALLLGLVQHGLHAQGGLSSGTTLTVDPGTALRFEGAQDLNVAAGASVVNNGTIAFDSLATITEAPGAPVTGSGVETTTRTSPLPLGGIDPAGLGLVITTATAPGTYSVTRGHLPVIDNGGMQSVARWYDVDAATNTGLDATVVFRYDPLELNGADENDLMLHTEGSGNYWWYSPSTVDMIDHTVTAATLDSLGHMTLFEGISTDVGEPAPIQTVAVRVDPMFEWISVTDLESRMLGTLMIHDAQGRLVHATTGAGTQAQIAIAGLAPGAYRLSVRNTPYAYVKP